MGMEVEGGRGRERDKGDEEGKGRTPAK